MLDQNLFIFPPKTHAVVMIEIITAIATLESFGYHFNNLAEPLMIDNCMIQES